MVNLRNNQTRANQAIFAIYLSIAFFLLYIVSCYFQYDLLKQIESGNFVYSDAEANDTRQLIMLGAKLLVYLVAGIIFIRWFRRAYFNLHKLVSVLSNNEGWAAGGWFVPIMNLYVPYRIFKDLIEHSDTLIQKHVPEHNNSSFIFLNVYWFFFLSWGFIERIYTKILADEESIQGLLNLTMAEVLFNGLAIGIGLILIQLVKQINELENKLMDLSEFLEPASPNTAYTFAEKQKIQREKENS